MSVGRFLQQAAAGNAGEAVYVDDVFSTYVYEGNGSTQTITNGIDLDGEGGLVWFKNRTNARSHVLFDTERGIYNRLITNATSAEASDTSLLTAFLSDGFSVAHGSEANAPGENIASWTFRKQRGFFDVVTYTGDDTAGRTVSHNLGSVPGMIIVKRTDTTGNWAVYHRSLNNGTNPEQYRLLLNSDGAMAVSTIWNNTAPTATEFTVSNSAAVNASGGTYVAYLFAHDAQDFGTDSDESIIKCGTFTGNPVTVDLGWEPQWILLKKTTGANNWFLYDTTRGWQVDGTGSYLQADQSAAEIFTSLEITKLNSTGVKFVSYGGTWVYVAIRRPHKPAEEFAATDLFSVQEITGNGSSITVTTGFPVDLTFSKGFSAGTSWWWVDRLRGESKYISSNSTSAESTYASNPIELDNNTGVVDKNYGSTTATFADYLFRRAPGFFDVVTYTGTGSSPTTIDHNLGAVPEMMIIKTRNKSSNWVVYHSGIGNTGAIYLQDIGDEITFDGFWNDTTPTDSVFTLGNQNDVNESGRPMIAYLFATVPGISKIGSYTGTSATQDIDCGFTNGARFVLVKRSSGNDPWILWDSERGIVSGNDPYLQLNSTAAQVTTTDYIDPLDSGFTLTAGIGDTNFTGQSYIFLAIA